VILPHKWNVQIFTDFPCQFINNLRMAWYFRLKLSPLVYAVPFALADQIGAMSGEMLDESVSFHAVVSALTINF